MREFNTFSCKLRHCGTKYIIIRIILLVLFLLLFINRQVIFAESKPLVWQKEIHSSIGIAEFKYEEEKGISVRTLRDNKNLQNIPVSISANGWIEFHDLDGDGYQDVVTHFPDWGPGGSPISHGRVWIFRPNDKVFEEAEDISGRGYIEKAQEKGCLILTYRNSWTKSPFYIGEYWCFDKLKRQWNHKKNILDRFPK